MSAALHGSADEARAFQRLYVLGCSRKGHSKRRGQFSNRKLALREPPEHAAAGGVGQRVKHRIEAICALFNQLVE